MVSSPREWRETKASRDLKLTADALPRDTRSLNLRTLLPPREWKRIRERTFEVYGRRCFICGYRIQGLECHEVWELAEEARAQRLLDVIPLCPLCHSVKHWVVSLRKARSGEIKWERMIRHFVRVNRCIPKDLERHLRERAEAQKRRDCWKWRVELKWRRKGRPPRPGESLGQFTFPW